MIEKARLVVTELPESCRKNLQITCYGKHFAYCFWSGTEENDLVVQVDENDKIVFRTVEQTWREFLKDVLRRNWGIFVGSLLHIVENIARLNEWTDSGFQAARRVTALVWNNLPNIQYGDDTFFQITA